MRTTHLIPLAALLVLVSPLAAAPPPLPSTPAAVQDVLYARPFTLAEGYEFTWRKEKPVVSEGYILVLKADPALLYPRQSAEPVLYVGDTTAQRVNVGHGSGCVVAIVPAQTDVFDLAKAPIWFGTPELPERVTAKTIAAERAKAEKAGIASPANNVVEAARAKGGERLAVRDFDALRRQLAPVVKQYAPDEADLAENLLTPRVQESK